MTQANDVTTAEMVASMVESPAPKARRRKQSAASPKPADPVDHPSDGDEFLGNRGPGALRSETTLMLHTRQAQLLISGRRIEDGSPGIVGLTRFAILVRSIWNAAKSNDPYGDWWLVKIEDALAESERELDALMVHVNRILSSVRGITVQSAHSVEPMPVPLTFTNPYGFRAAYLLAKYDEIARAILTGRHVGMLNTTSARALLFDAGRHVRRTFNAALGFRFLSINRNDVQMMTARAQEAAAAMGEVPSNILDGKLRASFAPDIMRPQKVRGRTFSLRGNVTPSAGVSNDVTERQETACDGAAEIARP